MASVRGAGAVVAEHTPHVHGVVPVVEMKVLMFLLFCFLTPVSSLHPTAFLGAPAGRREARCVLFGGNPGLKRERQINLIGVQLLSTMLNHLGEHALERSYLPDRSEQ